MNQQHFFRPSSLGHADIDYADTTSILTKASGFMESYDYTLNPYSGCSFGCTYCYAAFFARDSQKQNDWGKWVLVKENAVSKLEKMRKPPRDKSIYMGSVTDPYQPIERKLELVRGILKVLIKYQPRLVIQTRGPLATRDIDLFKQFETIQINMTVTTDDEDIRRHFEPWCPANEQRLNAIETINRAGIPSAITMTPLLPLKDPVSFAKKLKQTGIRNFVVQPFHASKGKFVRGTRTEALQILKSHDWTQQRYQDCVATLRQYLPSLLEGKAGFESI